MIYTQQLEGIKLDIQAVDITINERIQQHTRAMIKRLQKYISEINFVDIHFRNESAHASNNRTINVRLGIPGNDAFASDSGNHWIAVLKNVEEKLRKQLRKRKK